MGRIAIVGLLVLSACASASTIPQSVTAMMQIQIRERAGLVAPDWQVPGASHAATRIRLTDWARQQGTIVAMVDLSRRGIRGSVQRGWGGWIILIEDEQPENSKLYTLVHELAHLYGPMDIGDEPKEVIAEVTSAMVCQRLGLDVWPQTAAYLVARVPLLEKQTATVQRHGKTIDAMVEKLTKAATDKPVKP